MSKRKTHDEFVSEMSIKNSNVEVLGKYINNQTPIKCKCKICGCEWDTSIPINLLKCSFCCPECFKRNTSNRERLGDEEYIRRLKEKNIPLIPQEKYINNSTPILHKCSLCGGEHKYSPNALLHSKKCVICQGYGIVIQYGINSLIDTHPKIADMIIDKELIKNVGAKSEIRTNFICPNCNAIVKNKEIRYVVNHGLSCQKCSDGISYPMKLMVNVLEQLDIDYCTEVSFKNWNFIFHDKKYTPRYDIVFDKYIIEVDGGFHKRVHSKSKLTLDDIKYIDSMKDELALSNKYTLIRIDASESNMDYMKNSILQSELSSLYNLNNINWEQCHENSIKSFVKEVCDIWNSCAYPSVNKVQKICGYKTASVRRWLKSGAKIGLCNYNPKLEMMKNAKCATYSKPVICLNSMLMFNSMKEAAKYYHIKDSASISRACKNKKYSGGKDPVTKEPLFWMIYKDYISSKEVI